MEAAAPAPSSRISSIDLVRGVIMVLMAIDHVRVYSGLPAGGPTAGIFFTRWVTHFVAPGFAFFAGTGAFFHGRKLGDVKALSRYLWTRGLLLVLLELTLIKLSWTFTYDTSFFLGGVIWMLGWCMVLMAGLVRLPTRWIGIIGLVLILLQQALYPLANATKVLDPLWQILYLNGATHIGPATLGILFVIVPWIGVMAAGYWFGNVMLWDPEARDRWCIRVGVGATLLYAVIATAVVLSKHPGPNAPPALFRILAQQKYPASQLFLMMTLGPTLALLPLAGKARGWFAQVMITFGRVPLFYYMLHIPLIHVLALITYQIRDGGVTTSWLATAPSTQVPPDHRWPLWLLYVVFVTAVALLYVPCRWYAGLKARKASPWLSYL